MSIKSREQFDYPPKIPFAQWCSSKPALKSKQHDRALMVPWYKHSQLADLKTLGKQESMVMKSVNSDRTVLALSLTSSVTLG